MSAPISDLASLPIGQLLPRAIERLRTASLEELAQLLRPTTRSSSSTAAPPASPDALARAVLALPGPGSKLAAAERAVIVHALSVCEGNVSATARLLGIDRKALERKIRRIKRAR